MNPAPPVMSVFTSVVLSVVDPGSVVDCGHSRAHRAEFTPHLGGAPMADRVVVFQVAPVLHRRLPAAIALVEVVVNAGGLAIALTADAQHAAGGSSNITGNIRYW